eukprot:COSAG02_NODE_1922_length_10360_cov_38.101452_9_plen_168_part_00
MSTNSTHCSLITLLTSRLKSSNGHDSSGPLAQVGMITKTRLAYSRVHKPTQSFRADSNLLEDQQRLQYSQAHYHLLPESHRSVRTATDAIRCMATLESCAHRVSSREWRCLALLSVGLAYKERLHIVSLRSTGTRRVEREHQEATRWTLVRIEPNGRRYRHPHAQLS